jgi:hypothetical protein
MRWIRREMIDFHFDDGASARDVNGTASVCSASRPTPPPLQSYIFFGSKCLRYSFPPPLFYNNIVAFHFLNYYADLKYYCIRPGLYLE